MTTKTGRPGRSPRKRTRRERGAEIAARRHQGRMLALQVLYEVDLTDHDPEEAMARAFAENESARRRYAGAGALARARGCSCIRTDSIPSSPPRRQRGRSPSKPPSSATSCGSRHTSCSTPRVCRRRSAINEGVELAKRFGGENSGKFINGVLRTILEDAPARATDNRGESARLVHPQNDALSWLRGGVAVYHRRGQVRTAGRRVHMAVFARSRRTA